MNQIIDKKYCIGCGICAGVCPAKAITIEFDNWGYLKYNLTESKCTSCGMCLKVCPFSNKLLVNEDTIGREKFSGSCKKHHNDLGYYDETFVGWVNDQEARMRSSSGGVATQFLKNLLENKIVDYIVTVNSNNGDPNRLFKYCIVSDTQFLNECSGSAYYPVELSEILDYIKEHEGRFAVFGVPCFIKGIENAKKIDNRLEKRIVYTFSFACGLLQSRKMVNMACLRLGISWKPTHVSFRNKENTTKASVFNFKIDCPQESRIIGVDKLSGIYNVVTYTACNYCDDIFGECADVSFMDAWLPEYATDARGTSLVIGRNPMLFESLTRHSTMEHIAAEKVVLSQQALLNQKRIVLAHRLYLADRDNIERPQKRIKPCQAGFFVAKKIAINDSIHLNCNELFIINPDMFWDQLNKMKNHYRRIARIENFLINLRSGLLIKTLLTTLLKKAGLRRPKRFSAQ